MRVRLPPIRGRGDDPEAASAEPRQEPEPEPEVVPLVLRDQRPRAWNLWQLERLVEEADGEHAEERRLLLLHLRHFASTSGELPVEFDPLVREAFGDDLAELAI
jgi:hypothetical protein